MCAISLSILFSIWAHYFFITLIITRRKIKILTRVAGYYF
jgi:hypothetical protein